TGFRWKGWFGAGPSQISKYRLEGGSSTCLNPMLQRGLQQYPFETSRLPYLPLLTSAASAALPLERLCVPCWTMRLYLRAASTHFRPSKTSWLQGFSTYTSFPAWQAQIVIKECQWFGVAMEIASTSLFSSSFRTS